MKSFKEFFYYSRDAFNDFNNLLNQNHQSHLYLQADDRLYVNIGDSITKATHNKRSGEVPDDDKNETTKDDPSTLSYNPNMDNDNIIVGEFDNDDADSFTNSNSNIADGKHWIVLPLPATYSATNWPIRVCVNSCIY